MRVKNMMRTAAVTTVVAVAGLGLTQAASAAPSNLHPNTRYYTSFYGVEGQLDTHPGDGAQSWVWAYGGSTGGYVEYQFYDNSVGRVTAAARKAHSVETDAPVWRIRACSPLGCGRWT
ncbi:hypothetical protein V2S66_21205 [Streptomyces sp. V4-01]|uniref:Uncharacterized protein n=1 Tax=Actinacidiphila polyblastidii TaxID=3110430 RepID=A0ABU7PFB1_9ACTN|nr:hypothetical protein [Streptomyces sp. V4-01]